MGTIFLVYFFALMGASLYSYGCACRGAPHGTAKMRSAALLRAFCIAYLGSFDFLPAYGVAVYPLGFIAVLGFVLLANQTVRRYRLINITPEFAAKQIINAMDDALLVIDG